MNFKVSEKVVCPKEAVDNVKNFVTEAAKNFNLEVDFQESTIELSEVEVIVNVSTTKIIKDLFKATGAKEEEINKLAKIPSIVTNLLRGVLQNILGQMNAQKR